MPTRDNQNQIQKIEHDEVYGVKKVSPFVDNGDGTLVRQGKMATEAKQDDIIEEISNKDLMMAIRNLLQSIAYPVYIDRSANVIRNQVQSGTITTVGTVTTVTTVTGITNIDGYQGKMQVLNNNYGAWANVVRARIT